MNEYDELIAAEQRSSGSNEHDAATVQDDARMRLRQSLYGALKLDPDQVARAKRAGTAIGVPLDVATRNLPEVEQRAKLNEYDALLQSAPRLADRLGSPDFAKVAHDDADSLSLLETVVNSFRRGVPALKSTGSATALRANARVLANVQDIETRLARGEAIADAEDLLGVRYLAPEQRAALRTELESSIAAGAASIATYQGQRQAIPQPAVVGDVLAAETFSEAIAAFQRDPLRFIASIGPESLVQSAPGLLLAIPAGMAGGPAAAAATVGGNSFAVDFGSSILSALAQAGIDTNNPAAITAAARDDALMRRVAREAYAHAGVVGAADAASAGAASRLALPKALAARLSGRPLARELANTGAQVPVQGAFGAAGEAGGQIAAGQKLQPGEILAEFVGEAFGAPAEVASVGLTQVRQRIAAARAEREAAVLTDMHRAAAQSKLRQRDPEAFRQYVAALADDGPVQNVYVDAARLADALTQSGIEPQQIVEQVPSLRDQLPEAAATQGDVRIDIDEFATRIAGTALGEALLPHLKTEPDGMTAAEAQAYYQAEGGALAAEVEQAAQAAPADSRVQAVAAMREQVLQQLTQANRFTADVNNAYADLTAAFLVTMAERAGIAPDTFARQFMPQIVSQIDLAPAEPVLDQAPTDPAPLAGEEPPPVVAGAPVAPTAVPAAATPPRGVLGRLAAFLQPGRATTTRGAYVPATRTIALLQTADLSTFLHESGHFYLEVLADLAARPDAPPLIRDDMGRLLQWFGVADLAAWRALSLDEKRPHHERFARGFEAYLFEGQAPSLELQGVFTRFRAWLLRVYRALTALNVELSDEVRGVFGRMLASDLQVREAEAARAFMPLFASAEQAGMSPEQWAEYQALGREATREAVTTLERRSLRDMQWLANAKSRKLRELQRDAADKRKAVRREVEAGVLAEPVYRVRHFLMRGELPLGEPLPDGVAPVKLSLPALKAIYGEGADAPWRRLPVGQYGIASAEGAHPDVVAEAFGFTSGDEMVRALVAAEKPAVVIDALTDQRMLERYGDLADPATLEREAEAAIHNDMRSRFLEREVNLLARAVGQPNVLRRAAREFAEAAIARKTVRTVKPAQYTAAESRAGRAATDAFKHGDTARAAAMKRAQLLNHELMRSARRAVDDAERAVLYLSRFERRAVRSAIGPDYIEQIDALLERYDLRRGQTLRAIDRRKTLAQWVEAQRELGFEPVIDEKLLDEARRQHYRDLTVEELRGLVDTVKNIEHLGRLKQRLLTAQDNRAFAAVVDAVGAGIREHAKGTVAARIENELPRDKAGRLLSQYLVSHRKLASLVRQMDGGRDGGTFWTYFIRPMNEAGNREAVMREQATVALSKLFAPLLKAGGLDRKTFIPAINGSLTRRGRLAVALNWGNESNRQRVLAGENWSPAQAQAVLDTLTPQEWDFVQGVWTFLESFWPAIRAKEERVTGVAPEHVEPAPFTVRDRQGNVLRELRGGYYPIKYDPARSTRAESDTLAETVRQSMQGLYTRASTRRGHTKARVDEVVRPVKLSLGVVFEHVEQVIHDLAWHEWLIDANRLLRAKPIDAAIREHYGPDVLRGMSDALRDIAAGEIPAQSAFERAINHLRTGTTIAGLGWNMFTSLLQPLGLTQSMVRIGPKWVARGLARWLGDAARMENTAAWISERSDFMRLRAKTLQREINEIRNKVDAAGPARAVLDASFFYFITKAQLIADIPTWLGQYEKAIDQGTDEKTAVALADQAVLDSQGGGQIKDLAGVQRGGPLQKLFTNFYSFFNTTFNLTAESVARTDFRDPVAIGRLAVDFLLLYSVPAALGTLMREALRGDAGDDPEELAKLLIREQATYLLGTMVGLRELSAAVAGTFGYSGPAGTRFFSEATRLGVQVTQGEVDAALLRAANNAAGILFHYPAGQVQRTVEGIEAVTEGNAGPHAVLFGPPRR